MRVSYLAISEKRCTVQVAGCNFSCRGCFSKERYPCGEEITASRLAGYIPEVEEVMLAGGEPTMDRQGLVSLINELDRKKVILSTNGYLLDEKLISELEGITVHIDLKALDERLHRWYTGKDNRSILEAIRLLHEPGYDLEVSTVLIPGIVDTGEIGNIAEILSGIGNINYKIMRYVPVNSFSRRPEVHEIEEAVKIAGKHLKNVTSSLENRSHPGERKRIRIEDLF